MTLLYALALLAPDPTPEALALGQRLAASGTLAALLPMVIAKEQDELIREYPELSDAEKADFRATAAGVGRAGSAKLTAAIGRSYAEKLSIADLRVLVAFNEGEAARRWREATPGAVATAMAGIGAFDFKKDARAAFCAKTGKACEAR